MTPTAAPIIELTISEKIAPCQPMNAPMAPMNFTSPKPIASRGNMISALTASRQCHVVGIDFFVADLQRRRRQPHGHVLVAAVHQFHRPRVQNNRVRLAVKDFLVGNFPVRQAHGGFGENNFRVRRQFEFLAAKQQFPQSQYPINHARADHHAEHAFDHAFARRARAVQRRQQKRRGKSGDDSAERDFVGNDEMLEVNERRANQSGEKNGINQRERERRQRMIGDRRTPASSRKTPRR